MNWDNYEPTIDQKQEFKDEITPREFTKNDYAIAKEYLPKIIEVLTHKWKYGSGQKKAGEIMSIINFPYRSPVFRKLIQIYREEPEKWNLPSISGDTIAGYIIADKKGYEFTTEPLQIERYLKQQINPRRISLNKQTLGAEIQIQKCRESNLLLSHALQEEKK